jgi:hypothetical protein
MAQAEKDRQTELLQEILNELKDLRESFETFSNGGFPVERMVPDVRTLASISMVAALLNRDSPLSAADLTGRINAAMTLSTSVLHIIDQYQQSIQATNLDRLADLTTGGEAH